MFASNYQWLLVCLGNPGKEYETTRHNIGFMAADELARREGIKFNKLRYRALTGEIRAGGKPNRLIKPSESFWLYTSSAPKVATSISYKE